MHLTWKGVKYNFPVEWNGFPVEWKAEMREPLNISFSKKIHQKLTLDMLLRSW